MKNLKILGFIYLFFLIFFGCTKQITYPPEPKIDFLQLIVKDTVEDSELQNKVVMYQIYFKVLDGDNNFGLAPGDTLGVYSPDSTYYNNLFFTLLYEKDGQFDTAQLPIELNYRVPEANVVSLYNYFKATVIVDMNFDPNILESMFDTIKFSFYVVDRDLNKSNVQETPPIPVSFRGTIVDTVTIIR